VAQNQYNVSEWSDVSMTECCFSELVLCNPTERFDLVQSGYHYHLIKM